MKDVENLHRPEEWKLEEFPLAPMGVLTSGLCTLDPLLSPPSTPAEIFLQQPLRTTFENTSLFLS